MITFKIVPIPGASSITASMSVSGFKDQFLFYGFLPKTEKEKLPPESEILPAKAPALRTIAPHAHTQLRTHARHEHETKPKPISRLGSSKDCFP